MTLIFKSTPNKNYFFGYYGKSQLDKKNKKFLSLNTNFFDRMPENSDIANIGYFDIKSKKKEYVCITQTKTFNWQQGCMLQWLGPDFEKKIIYNDIINNKFCSIIMNLKTKEKYFLPIPIYDVNSKGTQAICVDQERHFFCRRGYSYAGIENQSKNKKIVNDDGIWLLNIKTKQTKQIINIKNLINYKTLSSMKNATHYVEHLMFNPDGKRFCFLHRWKMSEGGIYSRFFTVNTDGSGLFLLLDSGRMSHFCWRSNNEILAYGGVPNALNKLRKNKNIVKILFKPILPIYHFLFRDNSSLSKMATGDSYILLKDQTNYLQKVASKLKFEDGHPTFLPNDNNLFVTDIYPKKYNNHEAKLMIYNLKTNVILLVDKLKSNKIYDESPLRCDLHPKVSFDGSYISIDTMHSNYRSTYLYEISKTLFR